ncbi:MAG: hypothetical protein V1821_00880 [bacterium]
MPKHTLHDLYEHTWFLTTMALAACVLLGALMFLDKQDNQRNILILAHEIQQLKASCSISK